MLGALSHASGGGERANDKKFLGSRNGVLYRNGACLWQGWGDRPKKTGSVLYLYQFPLH
jgi:hypothetical protein